MITELVSITDRQIYNPSINSIFTNTNRSNYWSATTVASNTSNAWLISFNDGSDGYDNKLGSYYVRFVRLADD